MTTKEDIRARASLNAIGNGALGGPMGNAGTGTGMLAGLGADIGQDATNSMGGITADTQSCMPMERSEESYQFSARQTPQGSPGRMGTFNADSHDDLGNFTSETNALAALNGNNFKA